MAVEYHLAHKYEGDHLAYKYHGLPGENHLIYTTGDEWKYWVEITVRWGSETRDVDICSYWIDNPDVKVGFGWSHGTIDGTYRIYWESGDDTGFGGHETLHARIAPWEAADNRKIKIHFNVYGEGPGEGLTVTATYKGTTITKHGQDAGVNYGEKAKTTDPCCTIEFDALGVPIEIN